MKALAILLLGMASWLSAQTQIGAKSQVGGPTKQATQSGKVWAHVQISSGAYCSGTSCASGTISATTANSVLTAFIYNPTTSNIKLSSCSSGGGTWVPSTTSGWNNYTSGNGIDVIYNLTGTGGATSISCTASASCSTCFMEVEEWKCAANCGAGAAFDLAGTNPSPSAGCTSCTASSFTAFASTSELAIQIIAVGSGGNVNGNPIGPYVWDSAQAVLYAFTSSIVAPTVSQTPSVTFNSAAAAFK